MIKTQTSRTILLGICLAFWGCPSNSNLTTQSLGSGCYQWKTGFTSVPNSIDNFDAGQLEILTASARFRLKLRASFSTNDCTVYQWEGHYQYDQDLNILHFEMYNEGWLCGSNWQKRSSIRNWNLPTVKSDLGLDICFDGCALTANYQSFVLDMFSNDICFDTIE